jgi:type I restriction enzyme S subunit
MSDNLQPESPDEIRTGWKIIPLKKVVSKLVDGSHAPPGKQEHGRPMLSARNIENNQIVMHHFRHICDEDFKREHARTRIAPGDVLLTIVGSIGRSAVVPDGFQDFTLQRSVAVLTPNGLLPKYLMYQLQAPSLQRLLEKTARGTAQKGVYLKTLGEIPILVAPLDEQNAIVAEIEKQFSRLDEAVANLKRVKANLKRYKAAVLKAAVEGKLTEQWRKAHPDVEPASELLKRILAERRRVCEGNKWLGGNGKRTYREPSPPTLTAEEELPNAWTWVTWDQIALAQNGRPFPSRQYVPSGFKLLRPGNLHVSGKVVWTDDNTRYMPERFAEENRDLIVRGRELVMNLTAQSLRDEFLGRVCLTSDSEECLLNQRLARLTPVIVSPEFLLYVLKAWRFRRFVNGLNTGSLIQHMFTSQLAEFTFPLPPLAEQQRIVAELDARLSVATNVEQQLTMNVERTERTRHSTLQRAFKGQL